jgi:molecular chaperone GrpE
MSEWENGRSEAGHPEEELAHGGGPADHRPAPGEEARGDTAGETGGTDPIPGLAAMVGELEEIRDRHVRLAAEFENYRKRTREELNQASGRAQAALVGSLVDALDDLERVHRVDPDHATVTAVLEGVELLERKLHRILAEAGMEILEPEDAAFDPEVMEAVVRVPTDDHALDDQVAQVLQRGVLFRGHLVRPARVAVHKVEG